ncbi:MAG: hypothetical protein Kow00103_13530 [Candidatus Caldatribacteriota bacterium]
MNKIENKSKRIIEQGEKISRESRGKTLNLEQKINKSYNLQKKIITDMAKVISKLIEFKDPYSIGHQQKVARLAVAIAHLIKLPQRKIDGLKVAALIHDIGKINLPTEIIIKPEQLIDVELNLVRNYPKIGYDVLKKMKFPWPVAEIVYQHQERLNGSGYPRGLKGKEILIEAKILAVAKVIVAMTSVKSYRSAFSIEKALEEISKNRNTLFDGEVVDACLNLFHQKKFNAEIKKDQ